MLEFISINFLNLIKMKNLMFLSSVALLCSCGTVNEETEIIITDTTVVDTTVVDTTVVNTFDPSGINNVQDLLDTLSNMETGTVIEE
tara:strand:- start:497 stop:757 length:261 start_codon:yes stop_codon:yes gene_type:complete